MSGKRSRSKKKTAKKHKSKLNRLELTLRELQMSTEMGGLVLLTLSLIILLSLLSFTHGQESNNLLGLVGYTIGELFHSGFGLSSYAFVPFLAWWGWRLFFLKPINSLGTKFFHLLLLVISVCMLLTLVEEAYPDLPGMIDRSFNTQLMRKKIRYHLGGIPAYYLYSDLPTYNLSRLLNAIGIAIIFSSLFLASFLSLTKISPSQIWERIRGWIPERTPREKSESSFMRLVKLSIPTMSKEDEPRGKSARHEMLEINPEKDLKARPSLSRKSAPTIQTVEPPKEKRSLPFLGTLKEKVWDKPAEEAPKTPSTPPELKRKQSKRENALRAQRVYNGDFEGYALPSPKLLTSPQKVDQSALKQDLKRQAEVLEETLISFGIEAKVGQINCGPTITSFEVHPAIGVKVQKIKSLENDIALNMEAKSIRIIAPIPGKAAIGIEVPNPIAQEVAFKDLIQAYQQAKRRFHVPMLLGKTVGGEFVMNDLAKMPHMIIAGATGSGKSVCINTIVMSILLTARPDEIKLLMVDPKKVELTQYSSLPHMLAPVITEPLGACAALHWLVKEMERRYDILKLTGVRNIDAFNNRKIDVEKEAEMDREIPKKMHFIVAIIDELADLMMIASNDIETPIARIAQMARAVGIHLILATQRPSREVITGLIKANFPARISFKVASRVNSQIVLDEVGAESLLGNGDMLFLQPGTSTPLRAQGAFIRDEDINSIIDMIQQQTPPNYVIDSFDQMAAHEESLLPKTFSTKEDDLYDQCVDLVTATGNASTTYLQRKLKVGYARAAGLMDQLEENGVVSPSEGGKPRRVLVGMNQPQEDEESAEMSEMAEELD